MTANIVLFYPGSDYSPAIFSLVFLPDISMSHIQCRNISVAADEVVEDTEEFFVNISSTDSSVRILIPTSSVIVVDNSSK